MMKSKFIGVLALFASTLAFGQEFKFKSELPAVNDSGYYQIPLSPELLGQLTKNWSDLRVYDHEGEEQPYIRRMELEISTRSLFREYEITDKVYKEDAISHLIFSNPSKEAIDNVSFLVKNTDVKKRARLSGSDDLENWYVIKDNYLLHAMKNEEETSEMKMLNFPLSDYSYFKLEINDNWKLPINILKVGYYDTQQVNGLSTSFDCPITAQKDSLKQSIIDIKFSEPRYLEDLQMVLSGEEYYLRPAQVSVKREGVDRKKNKYVYYQPIGSFELNSNSENKMAFEGTIAQEIQIQIDNRDNHPLKVESVSASYLNKYLVMELLPTFTYSMKFGDESLRKPDYDLKAFSDQIPADIPQINHGVIQNITSIEEPTQTGFWNNKYLVWSVIAIVGFGLTYISFKMIKEIGG